MKDAIQLASAFLDLAESFIEHDGYRVREIQTSNFSIKHWNGQRSFRIIPQQLLRQTPRLWTKHQTIVLFESKFIIRLSRFGGKVKKPHPGQKCLKGLEVAMAMQSDLMPIIQSSAPHRPIIEAKPGDADNVQRRHGGGAKPRDVSGILRNLRFDEGHIEHESCRLRQPSRRDGGTNSQ